MFINAENIKRLNPDWLCHDEQLCKMYYNYMERSASAIVSNNAFSFIEIAYTDCLLNSPYEASIFRGQINCFYAGIADREYITNKRLWEQIDREKLRPVGMMPDALLFPNFFIPTKDLINIVCKGIYWDIVSPFPLVDARPVLTPKRNQPDLKKFHKTKMFNVRIGILELDYILGIIQFRLHTPEKQLHLFFQNIVYLEIPQVGPAEEGPLDQVQFEIQNLKDVPELDFLRPGYQPSYKLDENVRYTLEECERFVCFCLLLPGGNHIRIVCEGWELTESCVSPLCDA